MYILQVLWFQMTRTGTTQGIRETRVEFKRLQGAVLKLFCLLIYRQQSVSLRRAWVTCRELAAEAGCPGGSFKLQVRGILFGGLET